MLHIISPHIDDAIFSIGGLIEKLARRNEEISIHYVFSLSDWTNPEASFTSLQNCSMEAVTVARKREEWSVGSIVSYNFDFLDFPDFPLRADDGNKTELREAIAAEIRGIATKHDAIFFPVGLTHPDHIIVGEIGKMFFAEKFNVVFYEDLPYVAMATVDRGYTAWLQTHQYELQLERINIESKISLMSLYHSQTSEEWIRHVREHSFNPEDKKSYERFWRPSRLMIS